MDHISQDAFLTAVATGCPAGLHLIVAENGQFGGKKWNGQALQGASYFSTGFSRTNRRRNSDIGAVRAIVLGDVGTKVDAANIKATPSWVMETSAGNFQYGFLLNWPDDLHAVEELVQGCIDAGINDPGESGVSRLNRVPGSINMKPGRDGFVSRVTQWRPDLVYTLKTLAAALDVKPAKVAKRREFKPDEKMIGAEDPIFDFLVERGMVVKEKADGWWEILCPFADEHKADARQDAAYKHLGSGGRAVKCFHGHGGAAYAARFFAWVTQNGGPKDEYREPHFDLKTREALAKITSVAYIPEPPMPLPRKPVKDPSTMHTYDTLRAALGSINVLDLPDLKLTAKGAPAAVQPSTHRNVEAALRSLGVQVRLNLMTGTTGYILPERIDPAGFGHLEPHMIDAMIHGVLQDVFTMAGMTSKQEVDNILARIANSLYWHPMKDWIESVPWDGKDRIGALLGTVKTPTPDLFSTYFRRWLLQGVEAACGWSRGSFSQKGLVLVLVGKQGIGKTRWLMSLAPGFGRAGKHLNLTGHNARDSIHQVLQGGIVELGELDATFRKSDISALKAFITDTHDEYRLPYARDWLKRPRAASLCGSVNDGEFLNDPSGSRRFMGVVVEQCNPEHEMDMQQVWAQVHTAWAAGEQWWLTTEEEAAQEVGNVAHTLTDAVYEDVLDFLAKREDDTRYPVQCSLGTHTVMKMMGLDLADYGLTARVSRAMTHARGKKKNLRSRGGGPRDWVVNCTSTEQIEWRLPILKPVTDA